MKTLSRQDSLAFIQAMETILKLVLNNDDVEVIVGQNINDQCADINDLLGIIDDEGIPRITEAEIGGAKA